MDSSIDTPVVDEPLTAPSKKVTSIDTVNNAAVTVLTIDGMKLSVPKKYILPGLPSSFFPTEGLDISRAGGLISIPIEDLGITKRGSGGFYEKINVLISGTNGRFAFGGFKAWNGKGVYSNRIIEFDDQLNLL